MAETNLVAPLLVVGAVLCTMAAVVLRASWFAGRRGDVPHCPRCDYTLAGIDLARCPECGTAVSAALIVRGERVRHPGPAAAGAMALLLGLGFLLAGFSQGVRRVAWYGYKPADWLLADLESSSPSVRATAWNELDRRDQEGRLTPNQRDRLFGHALRAAIRVRREVVEGDIVPAYVDLTGQGPAAGWWSRMRVLKISGQTLPGPGGFASAGFGSHSSGISADALGPGRKTLEIVVELAAFRGEFTATVDHMLARPTWSRQVTLTAPVRVVPAGQAEPIAWIDDPGLTDTIKASLRETYFATSDGQLSWYEVHIARPPVDVAFEVFVRQDGREQPVGEICAGAGADVALAGSPEFEFRPDRPFELVFRSSEKVARKTVDYYRIWRGEIVLPDVTVKRAR